MFMPLEAEDHLISWGKNKIRISVENLNQTSIIIHNHSQVSTLWAYGSDFMSWFNICLFNIFWFKSLYHETL